MEMATARRVRLLNLTGVDFPTKMDTERFFVRRYEVTVI